MAEHARLLLTFADAAAVGWRLVEHGAISRRSLARLAKQGAPEVTSSKLDAIDSPLAFGWVDGQRGRVDANFFETRFAPGRPPSIWS